MNKCWDARCRITLARLTEVAEIILPRRIGDGTKLGQLFESLQTHAKFRESVAPLIAALDDLPAFKRSTKRLMAHPSVVPGQMNFLESETSLFDQLLEKRAPKGLEGDDAFEGKTHVLNYYKAKGREFDYVVLVVDPRQESSKTPVSEKRRLYYVVATRAKKWLGVIYFGADHGSVLGPAMGQSAR